MNFHPTNSSSKHIFSHQTKKSGSHPIQFNSSKIPGFSQILLPGDASKLQTFPFHAHLATACCQHCQSLRTGATATFAVLVAGCKAEKFEDLMYFAGNRHITKKIHQQNYPFEKNIPQVLGCYIQFHLCRELT